MRNVIKKENAKVVAFQLGQGLQMEQILLSTGKLLQVAAERYEVFSQEASGDHGEIAYAGDYVKIDSAGFPYPNKQDFFEQNHRIVDLNEYEQIAKPLLAWCLGDPVDEVISFMIQQKGLVIDPRNAEKCFTAPLWGTMLSAKSSAVIVVYQVDRDEIGHIIDVDFNFVAHDEFEKTYLFLE